MACRVSISSRCRAVFLVIALPTLPACETIPADDPDSDAPDFEDEDSIDDEEEDDAGMQPPRTCTPHRDDCGEDEKCAALPSEGDVVYDCVSTQVEGDPIRPFDPCTVASNGQDNCPVDHSCLPVNADAPDFGACLELCTRDSDCDDASLCRPDSISGVPVCAAVCDPLDPLCSATHDCLLRAEDFICDIPNDLDESTANEPCTTMGDQSGCAEGFVCLNGGLLTGCDFEQCCTPVCDTADSDGCSAALVCNELPTPSPRTPNVGACYVPL